MKIKFIIGAFILSLSVFMGSCTKDSVSIPIESSSEQELITTTNTASLANSFGNADPFISIITNPGTVQVNNTTTLQAGIGNAGNGSILSSTIKAALKVGNNAQILGLATGSDPRWTISSLGSGNGNTVTLINTGGGFTSFDLGDILLSVKGTVASSATVITGNVTYIVANNPALGGALNSTQGNASPTNDDSQTSLTVTAAMGNADPFISIITNPGTIKLNKMTILKGGIGNAGNGSILKNTLRATFKVGNNAQILGLAAGSDPRWTISSSSIGNGNTVTLINTGGGFTSFDLGDILLNVKGTVISSATVIKGNVAYIVANNPALGGALNSTQGNAAVGNDDSQTSLTVKP